RSYQLATAASSTSACCAGFATRTTRTAPMKRVHDSLGPTRLRDAPLQPLLHFRQPFGVRAKLRGDFPDRRIAGAELAPDLRDVQFRPRQLAGFGIPRARGDQFVVAELLQVVSIRLDHA